MLYLSIGFCFMFFVFFTLGVFSILGRHKKPLEKLKNYDKIQNAETFELNKKENFNVLQEFSRLIPQGFISTQTREKTKKMLVQADIPITVEECLVAGFLLIGFVSLFVFVLTKNIIITIFVLTIIMFIIRGIINKRKNTRMKEFNEQINEGVMIISNSLRAGYSFMQAIQTATEETKDPFSKEFKKVLKELGLGISTDQAFEGLLYRMPSDDLKLILNAVLIQRDIGGNLSEILDNISETIRERQKIQNELKTLTAQGKLSGLIIILMPIFLSIAIYLMNPEYVLILFRTSFGLIIVALAIICQCIGIYMIRKIVHIEM